MEREKERENMLSVTHKLVYRELNKDITRDVTEKEVREAAFQLSGSRPLYQMGSQDYSIEVIGAC